MTIEEKLKNINKTSTISPLNEYPNVDKAKDFDELWEKVIEPNLPDKDIVEKWHNILTEYINFSDAAFSLRTYASPSGNSPILRRGFLNKVFVSGVESFETFYVDNGFTAYFYAMAKDGYAPKDCEEFKDLIRKRKIPCCFIQTASEKELAAYLRGVDPRISGKGYKIAHIFAAGENYNEESGYQSLSEFCGEVFPRGDRSEWSNVTAEGDYYRRIDIDSFEDIKKIKSFAVAHFLRTVHPINYFLVPNKPNRYDQSTNILKTNIYWHDYSCGGVEKDEIGEYEKLIEYVASKIKARYGKIYDEFLGLIYPNGNCINPTEKNLVIDARYAIGIWREKTGAPSLPSSKIVKRTPSKVRGNDYSKYSFNGKIHNKGQLVIALVDKYLEENPTADIKELKGVFDFILGFNKKPIVLLPEDTPPSLKRKAPIRILRSGAMIYINNQVQICDMDNIVLLAEKLKYNVGTVD